MTQLIKPIKHSAYSKKQEAQLSQRHRATLRVTEYFAKSLKWLKISQGHLKWHCWVGRVQVPIVVETMSVSPISYVSEILSVQEWRDHETGVQHCKFKVIENDAAW